MTHHAIMQDRLFRWRRLPEENPARGAQRLRVGLLAGCVQSVVYGLVDEAYRAGESRRS